MAKNDATKLTLQPIEMRFPGRDTFRYMAFDVLRPMYGIRYVESNV